LGDADFARELNHAACRVDRAIESGISHGGPLITAAKRLIVLFSRLCGGSGAVNR
jgi:hypothetical protein